MLLNTCKGCGIEWQDRHKEETCPRCRKVTPTERHPLADAPPLPSNEIEAIKVAMLQTGWTWKGGS